MKKLAFALGAVLIGTGIAHAKPPVFVAQCPGNVQVDADRTGTVYVNGQKARVKKFNENYYEASHGGVVYSIARDVSNGELLISYTGPGRANGVCTLSSSASQGAVSEPATSTERVRFSSGATGTELYGKLTPGSSTRYVLNAKAKQFLEVSVAPNGPDVYYQIFNPDGSFLLEQMTPDKPYKGQLWQSGDHVIEVINRGSGTASYSILISVN
mgnify:CR=1 FL=1